MVEEASPWGNGGVSSAYCLAASSASDAKSHLHKRDQGQATKHPSARSHWQQCRPPSDKHPTADSVAPKAPDDTAKATTRTASRSPQPMPFETPEMRYERQKPKPKRPVPQNKGNT
ncbi:hypothetical protein S40285_10081 [Stachybotrys chlorohalonatus IBT 40285]|uniref:Uncharacterized protein n=1 Tax=Stachybotrys chlorohalonatus (strain IBT 40285) TaxID=1283841 RepID=A0A084QGX1_STAC4|nr:hypothetical protein S40285_10081 [Stachybotrys chlorohalonata IBT 40285]